FTSGCSPPRLAATQLPLVTGCQNTPAGTFTLLIRCPCRRPPPPAGRAGERGRGLSERSPGKPDPCRLVRPGSRRRRRRPRPRSSTDLLHQPGKPAGVQFPGKFAIVVFF